MPLEDFFEKIVALQEFDIEKETMDIMREDDDVLLGLLKYRQLARGLDGDGEPKVLLRNSGAFGFYSKFTEENKNSFGLGLGAITSRITHSMSGEFYASIELRLNGSEFSFESDIDYFDSIIAHVKGGKKIMELSPDNLKFYSENFLIPELQRRFNSLFNGI